MSLLWPRPPVAPGCTIAQRSLEMAVLPSQGAWWAPNTWLGMRAREDCSCWETIPKCSRQVRVLSSLHSLGVLDHHVPCDWTTQPWREPKEELKWKREMELNCSQWSDVVARTEKRKWWVLLRTINGLLWLSWVDMWGLGAGPATKVFRGSFHLWAWYWAF